MKRFPAVAVVSTLISTMSLPTLSADEGLWLFNNPPRKLLQEKYGFDPMWVQGAYSQAANGVLSIQLSGAPAGSYDRLHVTGSIVLGGILRIELVGGFTPTQGDAFEFLYFEGARQGVFQTLDLLGDAGNYNWLLDYTINNKVLLRV